MNQEVIKEYIELKQLIKDKTERLDAIKKDVESMVAIDQKVKFGNATLQWRKGKSSWKYSDTISTKKSELEDLMKAEEQTGVAEKVEGNPYLLVSFSN